MEQSLRDLPDMVLFVAVARAGSFRHAAARLGLPPSTLSRRIAAMESRLGVPLLLRTTRSVTLTSAATPYFERCVEVIEAAARARAVLAGSRDSQARMRIAMPVDLGVDLLGPAVAAFADAHPMLSVALDLSSHAVDLLRDPVDLAFRIGKPMDDRVVARHIADIASGLYAAPDLLRRIGPVRAPQRLAALPCLDLRTALGSMPWRVGAARWDAAPGPCTLAANSVGLLRRFAEDGRGIALLPAHVAAPGLRTGRLTPVLPDEPTPAWPLYAVTVDRRLPRLVRLLIADVRRALATAPLARIDGA